MTECDYFERLEQTSKVVYDRIKEKIKYFQPAFHSTTPEGFNARLTFLQQCMRQGRTHGVVDNNNPSNLAFGRPPVCILRIGDFYNTKIIIDNVTFDFEPLVWDLNPEGVGVQPMICNVNMSFSFIGGSSLNGPISKLQNALSYNYFANTELYTDKSDRAMLGSIYDGTYISSKDSNATSLTAANLPGASSLVDPTIDQEKQNEAVNTENTQTENGPELTSINFIKVSKTILPLSSTYNNIIVKMDSKNIISGIVDESLVKSYTDQGVKIRIEGIPVPDLVTFKIIDNNFLYEEIVNYDDVDNKGITSLVYKGYQVGTKISNEYVLDIPNGVYQLSVSHASVVIAKAVISVIDGTFYYPDAVTTN